MDDFISPRRAKPGSGAVERRNLPSPGAGYLSPDDARAYAEDLLRSAFEGPKAYTAEGLRKPLGHCRRILAVTTPTAPDDVGA
ncbi:hypothetical protein BC360_00735 [Ensifer sp. LC163]|nr:hypothetical protein BC360_00735 [Ensifer sp. LC163]